MPAPPRLLPGWRAWDSCQASRRHETPQRPPSPLGVSRSAGSPVAHVNAVIPWYRQVQTGTQWIGEASDRIYFDSEHAIANQVVQLAFKAAEADAAALPPEAALPKGKSAAAQSLLKSEQDAAAHVQQLQERIAGLDQQPLPDRP